MLRKIFKTGNSLVISLPREKIQMIGLHEGSEISLVVDEEEGQIVIEPASPQLAGVNVAFAQQLDAFIAEYRPALDALGK